MSRRSQDKTGAGIRRPRHWSPITKIAEADAYPGSKELLLLWTMQAAHQPCSRIADCGSTPSARGRWRRRSSRNFARSSAIPGLTTTLRASVARAPCRMSRPRCCFSARTARGGSMAYLPVDGGLEASIHASVLGF